MIKALRVRVWLDVALNKDIGRTNRSDPRHRVRRQGNLAEEGASSEC